MAVLGEKLMRVLRTTQAGWEVESGALFLESSESIQLCCVGVKGCHDGDCPQEAYVGCTWTDVGSVRVVLVRFPPTVCTSIRIAATLRYE
jgi:hypothetical protein